MLRYAQAEGMDEERGVEQCSMFGTLSLQRRFRAPLIWQEHENYRALPSYVWRAYAYITTAFPQLWIPDVDLYINPHMHGALIT